MTSGMRCTAIAVLAVVLTACRPFGFGAKVKPEPAPAAPLPQPVEVKAPPPKVEPPGPPPKIETKPPEVPETVAMIPRPPAPRPKRPRPKKTIPATGTPAATQATKEPPPPGGTPAGETASPPTSAANVPKLGEIYSDDQKIQLQRSCDESITRAREALGQLRGLNLTAEQKQSLDRVRIFISQAVQARTRDPQTAKQLAERADLLSRDLVRTLR